MSELNTGYFIFISCVVFWCLGDKKSSLCVELCEFIHVPCLTASLGDGKCAVPEVMPCVTVSIVVENDSLERLSKTEQTETLKSQHAKVNRVGGENNSSQSLSWASSKSQGCL